MEDEVIVVGASYLVIFKLELIALNEVGQFFVSVGIVLLFYFVFAVDYAHLA